MLNEFEFVSLEDLPDHLLENILKACDTLKPLRLVSQRMHGLVATLVKHLSLHSECLELKTIHKLFPLLTHLTIFTPRTTDNEGLLQIQEAFANFWTEEAPNAEHDSGSDTDSSDHGHFSHLGLFFTQSLPHLVHLCSLQIKGNMANHEVEGLIQCIPASCTSLLLPHRYLSYEKLNRLSTERIDLELSLAGQNAIYDTSALSRLPALARSVASLEITLMEEHDLSPLLNSLLNIQCLSLSWPCSGSVFSVANSCRSLISYLDSPLSIRLSHLKSLSLFSFLGSVPSIIEVLATLPSLRRLDIFDFNVNHYLSMTSMGLIFQHLPLLEHLGANGIDLSVDPDLPPVSDEWVVMLDQSQITLPAVTSLEVGISVAGQGRLRDVFPNLQCVQMRWSWSSLTRKLAGLLHLTDLSISCPEYLEDFRLLRTLPLLRRFRISKGCGLDIISATLEAFEDSNLEELSLIEWIEGKASDDARLYSAILHLTRLKTLTLSEVPPCIAKLMMTAVSGLPCLANVRLGWELAPELHEFVRLESFWLQSAIDISFIDE